MLELHTGAAGQFRRSFWNDDEVDLDQLRKDLSTYLTEFEKKDPDNKFPNPQRPLDLKNLRVVAFLQNDATNEVLQAVEVELQPAP